MKNKKSILIFASKQVGLSTATLLLERKDPIGRIVVADDTHPDNQKIFRVARHFNVQAVEYTSETQDALVREGVRYDWLVNLWSPYILRDAVLKIADNRLNIHSGIVPMCQGNDNVAWSIRKGLPAGAALLEMEPGVDTGGVYVQEEVDYTFPVKAKVLHSLVQEAAVRLFTEQWPAIYTGALKPKPQKGEAQSFRRSQTNADRVRKASDMMSLNEFVTWVLAHDFSPGTTAEIIKDGKTYSLRIEVQEKNGKAGI